MQNCGVRRLPLDFRDQYFGCEIELTGINRATAAQTLADLFGTRAEHSGGGYDAYRVKDLDGKEWKIVRDGSIHPECRRRSVLIGETYKVELNSPKLEYGEMEKLQEVVRSLRHAGGIVNDSCGMHVHVDASKHTPQSLKNVLSIIYSKEDILFAALKVNPARIDNYCQAVDEPILEEIRKLPSGASMDQLKDRWYRGRDGSDYHYHQSRYHALNLHSVFYHGTVEWRLFNSTLHASEVKANISKAAQFKQNPDGSYDAASILSAYRKGNYDNATLKYDFTAEGQAIANMYESSTETVNAYNATLTADGDCANGRGNGWMPTDQPAEYRLGEMFTNDEGIFRVEGLPYGQYLVVETTIPKDVFQCDPFIVTVDANSPQSRFTIPAGSVTTASNDYMTYNILDEELEGYLQLIKTDTETGKAVEIANTAFALYKLDDKGNKTRISMIDPASGSATKKTDVAYTSVIPVRRLDRAVKYVMNKEKTTAVSLQDALDYAANRDKTEQSCFESSYACTLETAFADMRQTKERWHKLGGVQGYHLVQSFAAGEVTPELAHRIAKELADRVLGGRYEYVIGTHLNTDHIHSHIVWNSVSCVDGKKYRSNYKSYVTEIRAVSDELCRKYKLSVIDTENSKHVAKPYAEWLAEKNGQPTWRTAIRQDVDEAIQQSLTWRQFLSAMERKGYEVRMGRKYPVLRPTGKERFVRFKTLGKRYTPEAIQTRILYPQSYHPYVENPPTIQHGRLHSGKKPHRKLTGLRALYYRYLYELGALPRKPRRSSYAVRQDAYKLDQRIRQMEFLSKHNIDTLEQLETHRQALQTEIRQLLTKCKQLPKTDDVQSQHESVNTALKQLRQEERLCRKIAEHSIEVQQHLTEARRDRAEQQKQEQERARDRRPDITTR